MDLGSCDSCERLSLDVFFFFFFELRGRECLVCWGCCCIVVCWIGVVVFIISIDTGILEYWNTVHVCF